MPSSPFLVLTLHARCHIDTPQAHLSSDTSHQATITALVWTSFSSQSWYPNSSCHSCSLTQTCPIKFENSRWQEATFKEDYPSDSDTSTIAYPASNLILPSLWPFWLDMGQWLYLSRLVIMNGLGDWLVKFSWASKIPLLGGSLELGDWKTKRVGNGAEVKTVLRVVMLREGLWQPGRTVYQMKQRLIEKKEEQMYWGKQVWHDHAISGRSWGGLISWWLLSCNSHKASCLPRDGLKQTWASDLALLQNDVLQIWFNIYLFREHKKE